MQKCVSIDSLNVHNGQRGYFVDDQNMNKSALCRGYHGNCFLRAGRDGYHNRDTLN